MSKFSKTGMTASDWNAIKKNSAEKALSVAHRQHPPGSFTRVRINARTEIEVPVGEDPDRAVQTFVERYEVDRRGMMR
jgi:hypothetical protein